ncbi:MAG: peptidoglycan DD-metalloendopeptidase family protein [Acidimicrobiia bacterium]
MRNRLFVAVALVIVMVSPAYAATLGEITEKEVAAALEARREASASLESMTALFEKAVADETLTRERIVSLSRSVSRLEREIGTRRSQVRDLVIARYMSGGSLGTERVFTARTFTDLPVQDQYYRLMNERDLALLRGLESAEALHVEQQQLLDGSLSEQKALVAEIGGLTQEILTRLEQADADYNAIAIAYEEQEKEKRRKAEEERRRLEALALKAAEEAARLATSTTTSTSTTTTSTTTTVPSTTTAPSGTTTTTQPPAPPPVITDGKTCPVNAAAGFSDTWGAPRSGSRAHKGVDMMAVRNAPLVAIESGTVTRTSSSTLGGISIYFTGESGNRYYYAHLEAIAPGISGGTFVNVGDLVGLNGSSGNSPDWLPHLHFQYAPPDGDWINPYPLVKALCG